eukprot:c46804_g1_i1.p1 GENE.c46804_g1_i1~~c46804_g1_i1.p1  ORF type:complete len:277 (+),score=48.47 c46804_g1_i1:181-1011(+)
MSKASKKGRKANASSESEVSVPSGTSWPYMNSSEAEPEPEEMTTFTKQRSEISSLVVDDSIEEIEHAVQFWAWLMWTMLVLLVVAWGFSLAALVSRGWIALDYNLAVDVGQGRIEIHTLNYRFGLLQYSSKQTGSGRKLHPVGSFRMQDSSGRDFRVAGVVVFILLLVALVVDFIAIWLLAAVAIGRDTMYDRCYSIGGKMSYDTLKELSLTIGLTLVGGTLQTVSVIVYGAVVDDTRRSVRGDLWFSYGFAVGAAFCTLVVAFVLLAIRCCGVQD